MNRIERSRAEAAGLRGQSVSEVTPSRRDFAQYVAAGKDEPAIIARLAKTAGASGEQLTARAVAYDDAEVAALSLSLFDGLSAADLASISAAVTAPLLREDPLLDSNQLYHSRLLGIDAIVLPGAVLDDGEMTRLVDVAVSMHMGVVIECGSAGEVATALRWPYTIVGVADAERGRDLVRGLPQTRPAIVLSEISTKEEYEAARGVYDAVVVGADVCSDTDVGATLRALQASTR